MSSNEEIAPLENLCIYRYREALENIPAPGTGCHPYLLSVANHGVKAGVAATEIFDDIRVNIPPGNRDVSDHEINDAINKARNDHKSGDYKPITPVKPAVKDGAAALRRVIGQGLIHDEEGLLEASPIIIAKDPIEQTIQFLQTLYDPDDLLFLGDNYDEGILDRTIRTAAKWIEHIRIGGQTGPFIIVNPLNGKPMPKKSGGGATLRGDNNVEDFKYSLVEFDGLGLSEQIKFWSAARLPIRALVHTGGKSIHAWIDVLKISEIHAADAWDRIVRRNLYDRLLKPIGVDGTCSNPSRLSRLPGCKRTEKGTIQRLLWASEDGRFIHD